MKCSLALRLLGLLVLATAQTAVAEAIRQPPELLAGDQYRLAFVTSEKRDATSSDINDYDQFVQAVADSAPEVGQWGLNWRAIGSTSEVDARDHTDTHPVDDVSVPIYLLDGTQLVDGYPSFWSPNLSRFGKTFDINEFGEQLPAPDPDILDGINFVWTGTDGTGIAEAVGQRSFWLGEESVGLGEANRSDWIDGGATDSANLHHVYAISDVLVAVPEPTGQLGSSFLIVALVLLRRIRSSRL